jgi:hypothetical protein
MSVAQWREWFMIDPIAEHKALIDELVRRTPSIGARLVREQGIFSKGFSMGNLNSLVGRLSADDREVLAQMLQEERQYGIFDALVVLHEACFSGLKLTKEGAEIPAEPFGYTMFEEYTAVLQDGDWSSMEPASD